MTRPLPSWLTVTTGPAPGDPAAAVMDGRACRTRAAFFEEAARALRLPGHFGRNWDALTDCLRDTDVTALVVEHAEHLLAAEPPEQFAVLLAVLSDAGLSVTLRTDAGHEEALRRRAAAAG
ncbi:Barstar (barnase inhibitor) [Nonomuraea maritima]|uniref:Barstar (Barnase inhibitor) n=1 Tax=Nonomuraea maritima TaxID=683260 RepID=A0A1G9JW27_9ACTN|nr:barstar family protein [Nonomuraea maritima]SDL41850.1 Barstar (barnase inhibitor) [Nonomuraea maritima]